MRCRRAHPSETTCVAAHLARSLSSRGDAMRKTLYDVLEIPTTANLEAVDASYRSLRDWLQSRAEAGDEESRMRLVAAREAWQTLSNAGRRRLYDASLDARKTPAAAGSV